MKIFDVRGTCVRGKKLPISIVYTINNLKRGEKGCYPFHIHINDSPGKGED